VQHRAARESEFGVSASHLNIETLTHLINMGTPTRVASSIQWCAKVHILDLYASRIFLTCMNSCTEAGWRVDNDSSMSPKAFNERERTALPFFWSPRSCANSRVHRTRGLYQPIGYSSTRDCMLPLAVLCEPLILRLSSPEVVARGCGPSCGSSLTNAVPRNWQPRMEPCLTYI
jgi:hypothetical protein